MVVEVWRDATFDATPAVINAATNNPLSINITTEAVDEAVSWIIGDNNETAAAAKTYRGTTTEQFKVAYASAYTFWAAATIDTGTAGVEAIGWTNNVAAIGGFVAGVGIQYLASSVTVNLGHITVAETPQAMGHMKVRSLGLCTEGNAPQALVRRKLRNLGLVAETNAAQAITRRKARTLGLVAETNVPGAFTRTKTRALGLAQETNAPQTITFRRVDYVVLGLATESNVVNALSRQKTRALGLATETNTPQDPNTYKAVRLSMRLRTNIQKDPQLKVYGSSNNGVYWGSAVIDTVVKPPGAIRSKRLTRTADFSANQLIAASAYFSNPAVHADAVTVAAGDVVSGSVAVRTDLTASAATGQLIFVFRTAAGVHITSISGPVLPVAANTWETIKFENVTIPPTAGIMYAYANVYGASTVPAGTQTWMGTVLLENWPTAGPYFDGFSAESGWRGVPELSLSVQWADNLLNETNTPLAPSRSKLRALGLAVESNVPGALTSYHVMHLGLAAETNTPQGIARAKLRTLGLVAEANVANAIARVKVRSLTQAAESVEPFAWAWYKAKHLGFASEHNVAQHIGFIIVLPRDLNLTVGPTRLRNAVEIVGTSRTSWELASARLFWGIVESVLRQPYSVLDTRSAASATIGGTRDSTEVGQTRLSTEVSPARKDRGK